MSLKEADIPIEEVLGYFTKRGIDCGLLVPTETGLNKSIMDAHSSLRDYLSSSGIHDYSAQGQGQEHKKTVKAHILSSDGLVDTTASLYRPETKSGDPRIWVRKLPQYAKPRNVVAVVAEAGQLYLINASRSELLESGKDKGTPLGALLNRIEATQDAAPVELVDKLRDIGSRGYIRSRRHGSTGIGYTLESLLGIRENSRSLPDYKGIEIKSGRMGGSGRSAARTTIISRVPDWKNSCVNSPLALLYLCGREVDGRLQLYCSLANKPNSFDLFLAVDNATGLLHSMRNEGTPAQARRIVQWPIADLREALRAKHRATCVVKARCRRADDGTEEFHYVKASLTRNPLLSNLSLLLESGNIELDFLLHLKEASNGGVRARDHGYLFKMWDRNWHLLFPAPKEFKLD